MTNVCNEIIDDIEDLVSSQEIPEKTRYAYRKHVTVRRKTFEGNEMEELDDDVVADSVIPGTQSIFVKTWGCTHNSSDSEYMSGLLSSYGYKITSNEKAADLWLLNSCTVKNPAEDHFRNEIEAAKRLKKFVVVAGCVPQGAPKAKFIRGLSVIGVQQIDRVVEVVEETLKGNSVRFLRQKKDGGRKLGGASLDLPKIRRNPLVEIIAINTGCLNQCTYCKTKHARGNLGSYPPDEIVARAKQSFAEGVVELWITSEDTGAYGRDIGTTLPKLLKQLLPVIPEGCMMRIGMTNPPYILQHLNEIAEILSHPRVYSFLHVPVQSGSDSVLTAMKREYTRKEFETVVDTLREKVPGITIATDVICGFPTETEEDFEQTMDLCSRYKFPSLFVNQFYPRAGTPAAKMAKIPATEVKLRTKKLSQLFQSYEPYTDEISKEFSILITEEANDGIHYVGHNKFYQQILVRKRKGLMGKRLKVKIVKTSKHCMIAEIIGWERGDNPFIFFSDDNNKKAVALTAMPLLLLLIFYALLKFTYSFYFYN